MILRYHPKQLFVKKRTKSNLSPLLNEFSLLLNPKRISVYRGGNQMKVVPVQEAEGMVLCHDITEIIPGKVKRSAFRKGHVVCKDDIPTLLNLGKDHLYVWEINQNILHENEAAERVARLVAGTGIELSEAREGKVELKATISGLLKINTQALGEINQLEQIAVVTIHSNQLVSVGKTVAACKIIPLVIENNYIYHIEEVGCSSWPLVEVKGLRHLKIGIVITGNEVYYGRIKDQFGQVLQRKILEWGSDALPPIYVPDDVNRISDAIHELLDVGAEMIVTTGGMSVDPDDVTPKGIRLSGGRIVTYGTPTMPGAMFMLAYLGEVPVMGLPGCVMYHKTTIFDLLAPRVLAGEVLTRQDIIHLAHGGLCAVCEECRYPDCGFGKGS
jgi:molybdenum cofactor synthesis domain-containing protein